MSLTQKLLIGSLTILVFISSIARADANLREAQESSTIFEVVNTELAKEGQQPLTYYEFKDLLRDLKEIAKDPIGFVDYVINMRERNSQICQGWGGCSEDAEKKSQF